MKKRSIIAIDGYSSCGKSTFAKAIAQRLGYLFIDSGAMYRAVTVYALGGGLSDQQLIDSLDLVDIEFRFNDTLGRSEIFLGGHSVDTQIRSVEVNNSVSRVASLAAVRVKLVDIQRSIGALGGVVMDGRDIGTIVFPQADVKIFMTADPLIRARRRYDEMGGSVRLDEIERNIGARDAADQSRADSPLRRADDAVLLDNSSMSVDQQIEWFDRMFGDRFY